MLYKHEGKLYTLEDLFKSGLITRVKQWRSFRSGRMHWSVETKPLNGWEVKKSDAILLAKKYKIEILGAA